MVAQTDGVADNLGKVRMAGRFAIAGKGEHVWQLAFGGHLPQGLLQFCGNFVACGSGQCGTVVGIETTLAIDAVETAQFAVGGHQIDAKRNA